MTSNGRKPQNMEPTITQNGALFAVQHRPVKGNYSQHHHRQIASPNKTISTLLELVVGNARWALGLYGTNEAALRALKNGRTGFRTWDALERKTAANQIGTLSHWNKDEEPA